MFNSPDLLALLIQERQRTVRRELRVTRRWRLRRALATLAYAFAHVVAQLAASVDDERAPESAVELVA